MSFVITGSNGFIGKNLLNKLKVYDTKIKLLVRNKPNLANNNEKIEEIQVDYLDKNSLRAENIFDDAEIIYHVAGVTKSHNYDGFYKGNILPAQNMLDVLVEKNIKLKRFVLISSQSAAGPAVSLDKPTLETDIENPLDQYGKSKFEAERIVSSYGDKIPFTIIRPGGVYGPGDVDFLNIFKMTKSGINVYAGVKNKYISLVFVEDLIEGIIKSANSPNSINKKYFLGDDVPLTWQQIHETIFKVVGKKFIELNLPFNLIYAVSHLGTFYSALTGNQIILNKNKIELSKPDFWIASNQAAKKDFDYKQNYSFEDAVKITYDWYKNNNML